MVALVGNVLVMAVTVFLFVATLHLGRPSEADRRSGQEQ